MELQRRKELTEQMFHGMARIVDRFVVCDLENDHYEPCLAGSWIIWVKNKVLSAQTAPYFMVYMCSRLRCSLARNLSAAAMNALNSG